MNRAVNLLSLAVVALSAPMARATIQIAYSIDGGAKVVCATNATNSGPISCGLTLKDGDITFNNLGADSNSPGSLTISDGSSSTTTLANTGTVSHTVEIFVFAQGFTMPGAPPTINLDSHIGGTVLIGSAANLLEFKSCVDGTGSASACPNGSFQSGVGKPAIKENGSFQDDQLGTINTLSTPYTISEDIKFTLGAGTNLGFQASTTLTSTPEPTSIALLGGVILFSSRLVRRKLKRVS